MKRKVQAQRKFAQNAPITPTREQISTGGDSAMHKVRVPENPPKLFHMKATNVLDLIAFQNIHRHTHPVVLVEKLQEKAPVKNVEPKLTNGHAVAHKEVTAVTKHKLKTVKVRKIIKRRPFLMPIKRNLRSTKPLGSIRAIPSAGKPQNRKVPVAVAPIKPTMPPKIISFSDSSTDDDQPLKNWTKKNKLDHAQCKIPVQQLLATQDVAKEEKNIDSSSPPHKVRPKRKISKDKTEVHGSVEVEIKTLVNCKIEAVRTDTNKAVAIIETTAVSKLKNKTTVITKEESNKTVLKSTTDTKVSVDSEASPPRSVKTSPSNQKIIEALPKKVTAAARAANTPKSPTPSTSEVFKKPQENQTLTSPILRCNPRPRPISNPLPMKNKRFTMLKHSIAKKSAVFKVPRFKYLTKKTPVLRTPQQRSAANPRRAKKRYSDTSNEKTDSSTDDEQPLRHLYQSKRKRKAVALPTLQSRLRTHRSTPATPVMTRKPSVRTAGFKKTSIENIVEPNFGDRITFQAEVHRTDVVDLDSVEADLKVKKDTVNKKEEVLLDGNPSQLCLGIKSTNTNPGLSKEHTLMQQVVKDSASVTVAINRINTKDLNACPIASSCPSALVQSPGMLQDSANINMTDCCKKCANCKILKKIYDEMFTNMENATTPDKDVYNFQTDVEAEVNPICGYREHCLTQQGEEHCLYLDLFQKNCPYVIQIVNVSNQEKPLMRARVIPRAKVNKSLINSSSADSRHFLTQANFLKEILSSLKKNSKKSATDTPMVKKAKKLSNMFEVPRKAAKAGDAAAPKNADEGRLIEAPVFRPTSEQFENALAYIEKIRPEAEKFGLCKIIPPEGFKPPCNIPDDLNFLSGNQYICKMYTRWASASREMCAIKSYLATQNVIFKRAPLIDGVEVNLAKLYYIVQRMGGLKQVIQKKKWSKVAEDMNYGKSVNIVQKLDRVYVKYILPYDTLTTNERQEIIKKVELDWSKRYQKMLNRASNPLHRQKRILGESSSEDDEETGATSCLEEAEDCVVPGRMMNLQTFRKIAQRITDVYFPNTPEPTPKQVEDAYWNYVMFGGDHICVNTASIDTGEKGYGFTKSKLDPFSKHSWNLKVLSNSPESLLRSLGPVLSVTVPTLHLGMVFTTSCWHRDPHGLPWIEYLHEGPPKIWYGIPNEQSERFRKAVETLAPAYCQNKAIWLPSDIAMIPPKLLTANKVSLSKITQEAGQFIVVFPKAYSSSVCTGLTISESVYYAPNSWMQTMQTDFQEVRDSCEPTMFSLEHLLTSMANDPRVAPHVLIQIHNTLDIIIQDEKRNRLSLTMLGVPMNSNRRLPVKRKWNHSWNVGEHTECDICRRTLFLSKVSGITDKNSDLCLPHALRLLEGKSRSELATLNQNIRLLCFYTEDVLEDLMASLRNRLSAI